MVVGNAAQLTVTPPGTYTVTANHGAGSVSCEAPESKVVGF